MKETSVHLAAFLFVWAALSLLAALFVGIYGVIIGKSFSDPVYGTLIWIALGATIVIAASKRRKKIKKIIKK